MREALHPKIRAQLTDPEELQLVLDWIVHVSAPGITNNAAFFDSYKAEKVGKTEKVGQDGVSFFLRRPDSFSILTNRASRLSYIPPITRLSLVYDGETSRLRPVPGVDYPGVSYEDEGSVPTHLMLTLRAPKVNRNFTVKCEAVRSPSAQYEYKWILTRGSIWTIGHKLGLVMGVDYRAVQKLKGCELAVFAREKGGIWGPPSFVEVHVDELCTHHYCKNQIESIDYGAFQDWYRLDDQDRIIGFTRRVSGAIRGTEYSSIGEVIEESYSDVRPKKTRVVRYSVSDGVLKYEETAEIRQYGDRLCPSRAERW